MVRKTPAESPTTPYTRPSRSSRRRRRAAFSSSPERTAAMAQHSAQIQQERHVLPVQFPAAGGQRIGPYLGKGILSQPFQPLSGQLQGLSRSTLCPAGQLRQKMGQRRQ